MTTATDTSDIDVLLTAIVREDLEGSIAQLRAAVNVFLRNPKPAIAENAKSLLESIATKAKKITVLSEGAHANLSEIERAAEARALATMAAEKQKWSAYANHIKEQLATCNRELAQSRAAPAPAYGRPAETRAQSIQSESQFTPSQKAFVRETIRRAWLKLQEPITYLLRIQQPINLVLVRQSIPLEWLGLDQSVHEVIYRATLKSVLEEREVLRAQGPHARLHDRISNVFHAMMNAVGN